MGWSSGQDIFDPVVGIILTENIPTRLKSKLITTLIIELEDKDWDTQCESAYYYDPLVKKAFKKLHPDWYEGED